MHVIEIDGQEYVAPKWNLIRKGALKDALNAPSPIARYAAKTSQCVEYAMNPRVVNWARQHAASSACYWHRRLGEEIDKI